MRFTKAEAEVRKYCPPFKKIPPLGLFGTANLGIFSKENSWRFEVFLNFFKSTFHEVKRDYTNDSFQSTRTD